MLVEHMERLLHFVRNDTLSSTAESRIRQHPQQIAGSSRQLDLLGFPGCLVNEDKHVRMVPVQLLVGVEEFDAVNRSSGAMSALNSPLT